MTTRLFVYNDEAHCADAGEFDLFGLACLHEHMVAGAGEGALGARHQMDYCVSFGRGRRGPGVRSQDLCYCLFFSPPLPRK